MRTVAHCDHGLSQAAMVSVAGRHVRTAGKTRDHTMRTTIIDRDLKAGASTREAWVELTSEDEAHPIESALVVETGAGWRASAPGEQVVRLLFDEPLGLPRIQLQFRETEQERTQEFALSWSGVGGQTYREVVRQPYHFSPPGHDRGVRRASRRA
jgi:hypothetical protein